MSGPPGAAAKDDGAVRREMPGRQAAAADLAILAALCLATALVYMKGLRAPFHFDDKYAVLGDEAIRDLANVPSFFLEYFNRPVLRATFALNYSLGGESVFGYHLVNLLLHLAATVEVYVLAVLLAKGLPRWQGNRRLFPLVTASLFALHPVQTGAVTYIASRSSVLAALFALASFCFFLVALDSGGRRRVLAASLSAAALLLGLGAKATVAALPAAAAAFTLAAHQGDLRAYLGRRWRVPAGGGVLLLAYAAARGAFTGSVVPVDTRIYEGVLPPLHYFLTELKVAALIYPRWLLLPFGGPEVDPDVAPATSLLDPGALFGLAAVFILLVLALRVRRSMPLICLAILWYFIFLAPTSSFLPLGDVAVERRLYLPSVGPFLAAGFLAARLAARKPRATAAAAFCLCLLLGALTAARNRTWSDEIALWEHAARRSPGKVRVLNNRAHAYLARGDARTAERLYRELLGRFPGYPFGHNNLGSLLVAAGRMPEAIAEFRAASALRPDSLVFRLKLAMALEADGDVEEAIAEFRKVEEKDGANPKVLLSLATLTARAGRCEEAIAYASRTVAIEPRSYLARYVLGHCLERRGETAAAVEAYRGALALKPGFEPAARRLRALGAP